MGSPIHGIIGFGPIVWEAMAVRTRVPSAYLGDRRTDVPSPYRREAET